MRLKCGAPLIGRASLSVAKLPPKVADAELLTSDHKGWRRKVLERAGFRCEAPGCEVRAPARLYADHIVERKDGGARLDVANGQCLCATHHALKTAAARTERLAG